MKKVIVIVLVVCVILGILWVTLFNKKSDLTDELQSRLESESSGEPIKIGDRLLGSSEELRIFYEERDFAEAWSNNGNIC